MFAILPACDMLNADKDNIYTTDQILSDPSFAEGLLLQGYNALPLKSYSFEEVATDDAVTNNKQSNFLKMATGQWSSLFNPQDTWSYSYDKIAYLNKFLSLADNVEWSWESENRKQLFTKKYKGEAYALRAWYHFLVLQNHGGTAQNGDISGIPFLKLVPEALKQESWNKKRSSYHETVNEILTDLEKASDSLPWNYKDTGESDYDRVFGAKYKNRIDGSIATALKARVALHGASPAYNQGEYKPELLEKAIESSVLLIKSIGGAKELLPGGTLSDPVFYDKDDDKDNKDILWRGNYFKSRSLEANNFPPSLYGKGEINPTQNFVDIFPDTNGVPIHETSSVYNPSNPYENRDPRLAACVYYNGSLMKGEIINTIDDPKDGIDKQTNSTRTGYYLRKCLREDVSVNPTAPIEHTHVRPLIRTTEIFLIYAEAANELWGPTGNQKGIGSAKEVIKAIRKRGGISDDKYINLCDTKEKMRELIRNERRIELCFEGFRFWDIRRWELKLDEPAKGIKATKTANGYQYEIRTIEERKYSPYMLYGPIPNNEILKASELIQNKGW